MHAVYAQLLGTMVGTHAGHSYIVFFSERTRFILYKLAVNVDTMIDNIILFPNIFMIFSPRKGTTLNMKPKRYKLFTKPTFIVTIVNFWPFISKNVVTIKHVLILRVLRVIPYVFQCCSSKLDTLTFR